ncbi:hypothetical protein KIN20_018337 [Parelaphostrongylus tenuis]|uniref:Uncharacterized protein n=1 Tax=Parelaphostrongylus tenuis TaxID=148309 RepID=A0AAD5N0Y5_PARTN|nr:hypothetical protein KIN20_018337 [Parelaphostrongylus tenuis]
MASVGERYPAVIVLDQKPPQVIRVLDQLLQEFFVPSFIRSSYQFDRTLYFSSHFQPYIEESQKSLQVAMEEVNAARKKGQRCIIIPVGQKRRWKVHSCSSPGKHTNFEKEGPPIYILDADVGQSEFTPAGCMSLWKISDCILDVPYTHQNVVFSMQLFFWKRLTCG